MLVPYPCSSWRCRGSSTSSSARSTTARSPPPASSFSLPRSTSRSAGRSRCPSRSAVRSCGSSRMGSRRSLPSARRRTRGRVGRHGCSGRRARVDAGVRRAAWIVVSCVCTTRCMLRNRGRGVAAAVRVVVVSGIWPPDPGGPASHAPALADFLAARGHAVEVVTTADGARRVAVSRCMGVAASPLRHVQAALARPPGGASCRRRLRDEHDPSRFDRVAARASSARREARVRRGLRARARSGRYGGTLDEFQRVKGSARTRFLRATRNAHSAARDVPSAPRARTCVRVFFFFFFLGWTRWGLSRRVSVLRTRLRNCRSCLRARSFAPSSARGMRRLRGPPGSAEGSRYCAGGPRRRA